MNRRNFISSAGGSFFGVALPALTPSGTALQRTAWICITCGTQFSPSNTVPLECPICLDPRQYVGWEGQLWTNLETLAATHRNTFELEEENLFSIHSEPSFAIGQRCFLLKTPEGNILWDCVALLDQATRKKIDDAGGVRAIAISHPHFYTTMVEWSRAFADAPIILHSLDSKWIMRKDERVHLWEGKTYSLSGGLKLIRTGGHFDGFQVLHWPDGAHGKGVLLAGDQPQVCSARSWVSFMYSYPNYVPLGPPAIRGVVDALKPLSYDRLYSAFSGRTVDSNAKQVVERSAARYLAAISSTDIAAS